MSLLKRHFRPTMMERRLMRKRSPRIDAVVRACMAAALHHEHLVQAAITATIAGQRQLDVKPRSPSRRWRPPKEILGAWKAVNRHRAWLHRQRQRLSSADFDGVVQSAHARWPSHTLLWLN